MSNGLIGIHGNGKLPHQLAAKEIEQRKQHLEQWAKQLNEFAAQNELMRQQLINQHVATVRGSYIQCLNWAIDDFGERQPDKIESRANDLFAMLERRTNELAQEQIEQAQAKIHAQIERSKMNADTVHEGTAVEG